MADHLVVCAKREPCPKSLKHFHVTKIGTGEPTLFTATWTISQVCEAMVHDNRFSYRSPSGRLVELFCTLCPGCSQVYTLNIEGLPPLP
jgi:hypothetical protein